MGDLATLKLAQELVHFENELRKAQVSVRLKRVFPPTIEKLRRELVAMSQRGERPGVFHFLGHGDDDGLYFEDEFGESQLVKGAELKQALAESPVKLVLLNACWSATKRGVSLVEFLQREEVTETAIGHEVPVADVSAVQFAQRFYELAMSGMSVRAACQQASNSLAESGLPGAADVKLVGNGELKLTDGLPIGQRAFVSDGGMPTIGHLPDASVFFGRKEQLLAISRALSDSSLVGVGVWGIGGIGKTALVLAAARRNAWRYRGTAWVDIREATQKKTVELLRIALGRLSPGANSGDPQHALSQFLKGTPSLIVLDNLEDLPEAEVPALAQFLKQMPRNGSHVLLTARVPLKPVEEVPDVTSIKLTDGLDNWHGPHYVQHVARQKKCLALQDELRREHGELETTITGLQGLCVLVSQRLHGHPKMLELAVGLALQGEKWLNDALASLPDHLEDQLAPLLATTFEALGPDGQRLLPLLSFFPTGRLTPEALQVAFRSGEPESVSSRTSPDPGPVGGLTPPGSPSHVGDSDDDEEPGKSAQPRGLAQGLEQLVQAGMLDYDQATDTYSFHQSILDAVSNELLSADVVGEIGGRLLLHYAEYLDANTRNYDAIDRCFDDAILHMEALWSVRTEAGPLDGIFTRMVAAIGYYFEHRGKSRLGQIWHDRAIELWRTLDDSTVDGVTVELTRQASLLRSCGNLEGARELLNEALQRAEAIEDQRHISNLSLELAVLERQQGAPVESRRLLQRSIQIQESLGDHVGLSASFQQLAHLELHEGNAVEARRLLQRSIQIGESLGDQRGLSASLHDLAVLERRQGNPIESRRLLNRSMQIYESSGDQRGLSTSLHQLAILEMDEENPAEARRLLQRSIQIKESQSNQLGLSKSLHQLGNLEFSVGNLAEARRLWQRTVAIGHEIGDVAGAAVTTLQLAQLEAADGDGERALELARESVRELETLGYAQAEEARGVLRDIQQFLVNGGSGGIRASALLSALEQRISEWEQLPPSERDALLLNLSAQDVQTAVLTWLAHSVVCFHNNDLARCEAAQAQAQTAARDDAELLSLVNALRKLRPEANTSTSSPAFDDAMQAAMKLLQADQPAEAVPALERAVAIAKRDQQPLGIAIVQFYLGQVLLMQDRPDDAVTPLREALDMATQAEEEDLIKAIQQVLTVAVHQSK